jgi:hypothetical protein
MIAWARAWSAQFDYIDSLIALKRYEMAQTTCFFIQCAADDDDDAVTHDYAVAIKALIAACMTHQPLVPLAVYDIVVTAHPHLPEAPTC